MGLVNQEDILSFHALGKIPFQTHVRVKHVIVVTDNSVHEIADVQAEFKGTDLKLLSIPQNRLPGNPKFPVNDLIDSVVYPIKMPFCIGAGIRVALRLFEKAQLILGRDGYRAKLESLFPQKFQGLLGY